VDNTLEPYDKLWLAELHVIERLQQGSRQIGAGNDACAMGALTDDGEETTGNGSASNATENDNSEEGSGALSGSPGMGVLLCDRHFGNAGAANMESIRLMLTGLQTTCSGEDSWSFRYGYLTADWHATSTWSI
jgi:hypothetical protein